MIGETTRITRMYRKSLDVEQFAQPRILSAVSSVGSSLRNESRVPLMGSILVKDMREMCQNALRGYILPIHLLIC